MKLYVYDHCPYCVKARMIFGYKNISFDLISLLNDDETTPVKMIGQKMVPILEVRPGDFMPESLDIIKHIDQNFGTPVLMPKPPAFPELDTWLKESRAFLYQLAMPRWIKIGLEEFKTQSAINYFTVKKEAYIGDFKTHLENTPKYTRQAKEHLLKLETLIPNIKEGQVLQEGLSFYDIHLFANLRCLTTVKNLEFPESVLKYLKHQEKLSQVPLHFDMAL